MTSYLKGQRAAKGWVKDGAKVQHFDARKLLLAWQIEAQVLASPEEQIGSDQVHRAEGCSTVLEGSPPEVEQNRYLFVICKTNWRMNIMPTLLVPYIGLNLPSILFNIIRGDLGRWIASMVIMTYLFFQQFFLDYLGFPTALLLPLVTAPHLLMIFLRNNIIGVSMSIAIGIYLLDEHIRSNGPRQAFTEKRGCTNTLAIIVMLVSPFLEFYNLI